VLIASVGLVPACSRTPSAPAPPSDPAPAASSAATAPDARVGPQGIIEDWVVARLRRSGQKLRAVDYDWQDVHRAWPGIVATRSYWVNDPAMWLLIVRFTPGNDANAARGPLLEATDQPQKPPYYAQGTTSGAYLFIIGYASSKPVSPEMERHLTAYLSAFVGEE
jgi:hypothetical protein